MTKTPKFELQDAPLTRISNLAMFSHGVPGKIEFDYFKKPARRATLSIDDIQRINKDAFEPTATCKSWACNTATPTGTEGKTFTGEWKKYLGISMEGAIGRIDYGPTVGRGRKERLLNALALTGMGMSDSMPTQTTLDMVEQLREGTQPGGERMPVLGRTQDAHGTRSVWIKE